MLIKFLQDCELVIVESYDEENDHAETSDMKFTKGEVHDVDMDSDDGKTCSFQFGDGSIGSVRCWLPEARRPQAERPAYVVPKTLFVQYEVKENGYVQYEDYKTETGLVIIGGNKLSVVSSPGLLGSSEIHCERQDGNDDAFLKCVQWAADYEATSLKRRQEAGEAPATKTTK